MCVQPRINTDKHGLKSLSQQVLSAFIGVHLWLLMMVYSAYAQESITVAVASSFYKKAKVYATQFEAKHDVAVRLVSGSTGRLYNQIKQGAPFDIWITAGSQHIDLDNPYKAMGYGYLGIQLGNRFTTDLQELIRHNIYKIGIANPQTVPFGTAAKQVLAQAGLWEKLKPKLVYAQNAMQASMMVNQGLVDAAFVPVQAEQAVITRIPYTVFLLSNTAIAKDFYTTLQAASFPRRRESTFHSTLSLDSRLRGNDR